MRIELKAGRHDYWALVENGCVSDPKRAAAQLKDLDPERTLVVADRKVLSLHPKLPILSASSRPALSLEATERLKTLEGATSLIRHFLSAGVTRKHVVVALGGGILQDTVGFACSLYLRGLRWWLLPTTLLAQADSCIGSKTSINFADSKNLLGTFYPPHRILVDPLLLCSLPRQDLLSGLGEILKVHCMRGGPEFAALEKDWAKLLAGDTAKIEEYVRRSLAIKADFIRGDEYDEGPRQLLNYGHCFGHALEAAADFAVPHGIAVAAGILFANALSLKRRLLDRADCERMNALAFSLTRERDWPKVEPGEALRHLKRDKKREGALLPMILCRGLGRTEKFTDITESEFRETFGTFLSPTPA